MLFLSLSCSQSLAPDVQFLLSRAMAMQQDAGDARVTVAHLEAALAEATGGGRSSRAREPVSAPGPVGEMADVNKA